MSLAFMVCQGTHAHDFTRALTDVLAHLRPDHERLYCIVDSDKLESTHTQLWQQNHHLLPSEIDRDGTGFTSSTRPILVTDRWPDHEQTCACVNLQAAMIPWRDLPNDWHLYEIVSADDEIKTLQRERFKQYRQSGITPSTTTIICDEEAL